MPTSKLSCIFILTFTVILLQIVRADTKVKYLKGHHVEKIELRHDSALLIPGSSHRIGFVVSDNEGSVYQTKGLLNGSLLWNNFIVKVENGNYFAGELKIANVKKNDNPDFIPFEIKIRYQPDTVFKDTLWLNYEQEIQIFPLNNFKRTPGAKINFGLHVRYDNGSVLTHRTLSSMRKILPFYDVRVKGGAYKDGGFTISRNVFDNEDHSPGFLVELIKDTLVYDIFDIELDYIDQFNFNGLGSSGFLGFSGSNGFSGSTGQHGGHGQDGQHGDHGSYGHDIDVFTDIYYDSIVGKDLIKVFVDDLNDNIQQYFLINPQGGSIVIDARGGDGGSGGSGGWGGNGGKGYKGEYYYEYVQDIIVKKDTSGKEIKEIVTRTIERQHPGGDGGNGGWGGYGGIGGNGGDGGYIVIYHTPAMRKYLNLIRTFAQGGSGGSGGSGGFGGSGGDGGDGNPKGRSGARGADGGSGPTGYSGSRGQVEYKEVDSIPWGE